MSCRTTAAGRWMTPYARAVSGLTDVQIIGLVHELRRAAPADASTPTREQVLAAAAAAPGAAAGLPPDCGVRASTLRSTSAAYATAAADPDFTMSGRDWWTWQRLPDRAAAARAALDAWLARLADTQHVDPADVRAAFDDLTRASVTTTGGPRRTTVDPAALAYDPAGLPGDHHTLLTLDRMLRRGSHRCVDCGRYAADPAGHEDCPSRGIAPQPDPDPQPERTPSAAAAAAEDQAICGVCGGPWGADLTCTVCCDDDGNPHPVDPDFTAVPAAAPRVNTRIYRTDGITVRAASVSGLHRAVTGNREHWFPVNVDYPTGEQVTGTLTAVRVGRRIRIPSGTITPPDLRCTCPQYRDTYDCAHVRDARTRVQALLNRQVPAPLTPPQPAVDQVRRILADDLAASQTRLGPAAAATDPYTAAVDATVTRMTSGDPAPVPGGFADDLPAFQTVVDRTHAAVAAGDLALPYDPAGGTLGGISAPGTPRSFGLEIEIDFPAEDPALLGASRRAVACDIAAAGLSDYDRPLPWRFIGRHEDSRGRPMGGDYPTDPNKWVVEFDRSVDNLDGARGCEIKSPIMWDTPQTWANLQRICDIVRAHGGRPTLRTGLHVNVGAADYDHTVGNHNRVLLLGDAYEDTVMRMSTSAEKGRNRHRGRVYCGSVAAPATGFGTISDLKYGQGRSDHERHRTWMNFSHMPDENEHVRSSTRIEFRSFDGTIDPGRIQAAIRLSVGLVQAAADGRVPDHAPEPMGHHAAANGGRTVGYTGPQDPADTASTRRFIDLVTPTAAGREQLAAMWAQAPWQNPT